MTDKEGILEAAIGTIKNRMAVHGSPHENVCLIAELWGAYLNKPMSPKDVINLMVLLKIARAKIAPHNIDHYVDVAGYAGLVDFFPTQETEPVLPVTNPNIYKDEFGNFMQHYERNSERLPKR